VLAAIRDFAPTYVPAVPAIYVSLLNHPRVRTSSLERVRMFNTGGAPCPVDLMRRWESVTTRPLNQGYGLSEASPVTHSTPQQARRRPGTVGLPLPDTDVKIVDVETGTRVLPVGEPGELCVAGPQVSPGYWRRPDDTARMLRADPDGRVWLYTGDIASVDSDGFTTIVRPKTQMLIVDGFNVVPAEVESVLRAHPAVREAAVTAIPDAFHGEIVKGDVTLKPEAAATREEILAHCRKHLVGYKVPRELEVH
jgi:long-chain acyl-CoA synthetase